mmetsp:Transcript_30826/g.61134  ORF Transcript_30826/g.61134 Transcript_30826/m.61134 type:complete len:406 (+) Transcript_30826:3-1220(+)
MSPLWLECCNGVVFVLIPFVGYTRSDHAAFFLFGLLTLAAYLLFSLYIAQRTTRVMGLINRYLLFAAFAILSLALGSVVLYALDSASELSNSGVIFAHDTIDLDVLEAGLANERKSREPPVSFPKGMWPEMFRKPHVIKSVLSPTEAALISKLVLSRKADFFHQDQLAFSLPFFTFGAYWAYHCFDDDTLGVTSAPQSNTSFTQSAWPYKFARDKHRAMLLGGDAFTELQGKLREALASALNVSSVDYMPNMGAPGFHIIFPHLIWNLDVMHVHFDKQHFAFIMNNFVNVEGKAFDSSQCEVETRISITLPISLGDEGCGLHYLDFSDDNIVNGTRCSEVPEERRHHCHVRKHTQYKVGDLVIHGGALVHALDLGNIRNARAYDVPRMTLQAFGYRCGDKLIIYW